MVPADENHFKCKTCCLVFDSEDLLINHTLRHLLLADNSQGVDDICKECTNVLQGAIKEVDGSVKNTSNLAKGPEKDKNAAGNCKGEAKEKSAKHNDKLAKCESTSVPEAKSADSNTTISFGHQSDPYKMPSTKKSSLAKLKPPEHT